LGHLHGSDSANSFGKGYEYSRTGNPTRGAFERAVAAVEHAQYGLAFSSGLAATNAIIQTLKAGDHVLCIDDVYGGTQRLFRRIVAPNSGIEFDFIDMNDPKTILDSIKDNTKIIWVESPTNPTLKITDIQAVADIVRAARNDIWLVVDNTFMSPYLQNPLDLGAHMVVHSVSKYIGGHSDVIMGSISCNDKDIIDRLRFIQNGSGAVPSPFDCYLALRGLKTLHLRMDASQKNAIAIATYLESHSLVEKVVYPGLKSHPNHAVACKQASGFGAMITFYLQGDLKVASVFLASLKLFVLAESLGAVESLAESPAVMTHASVPPEQRAILGISDNMIRLSVGVEHVDDLLEDLMQALSLASLLVITSNKEKGPTGHLGQEGSLERKE
jgi:cystathionine gamma-lyase